MANFHIGKVPDKPGALGLYFCGKLVVNTINQHRRKDLIEYRDGLIKQHKAPIVRAALNNLRLLGFEVSHPLCK